MDWEAWARRAEAALDVASRGDWQGLFAPGAVFGDPHTPSTTNLRSIAQHTRNGAVRTNEPLKLPAQLCHRRPRGDLDLERAPQHMAQRPKPIELRKSERMRAREMSLTGLTSRVSPSK